MKTTQSFSTAHWLAANAPFWVALNATPLAAVSLIFNLFRQIPGKVK
jgi:hypothetical protein